MAWDNIGNVRGARGPQGPKGDTGDTGPQGLKGDTGAKGDPGLTGPQGDPGVPGVKGDTGDPGPQGIKGDTGPKGDPGVPGDTGPRGLKGDTGDTGATGDPGPQGETGLTGPKGDTGARGLTGLTGPKGDKGDPGLAGGLFRSANYTKNGSTPETFTHPYIEIDDASTIPGSAETRTQITFHTRGDSRTTTGSPRIYSDKTGSDQRSGQTINVVSGKWDNDGYSSLRLSPNLARLVNHSSSTTDNNWPYAGSADSFVEARGTTAQMRGNGSYGSSFVKAGTMGDSTTFGVASIGTLDMSGAENASFTCDAISGQVAIKGKSFSVPAMQASTTAGSAVQRAASGVITYASSSKVNKLDREELDSEAATAMLDVAPITWRDRAEVEDNPETTSRQVGFTVEQVAEVSERHGDLLEPVILRDDDGKPSSLAYDRMPDAYTLTLLQELTEQVKSLTSQVEELKKQVNP